MGSANLFSFMISKFISIPHQNSPVQVGTCMYLLQKICNTAYYYACELGLRNPMNMLLGGGGTIRIKDMLQIFKSIV